MRRRRRWRPRRAETRRRILIGAAVAGGLLAIVGLAASWRVFAAGRDLRAAEQLLQDAGDLIESGQLAEGRQKLADATDRLTRAQGSLANKPELSVLGPIPIVGNNLDELRESIGLATQLTSGGVRILTAAQPLEGPDGRLEVPLSAGAIPIDAVRGGQREVELLLGALPEAEDLEEDDPGVLLGPVRTLHDKVRDEAARRISQLDVLADGLAVVEEMAGGDGQRLYLIAVANTAEMRGSGGMILSYGGLVGSDGTFELIEFGRIDDLRLETSIDTRFVPDLPLDYLQRWEGFDPLLLWRNATMAADFGITAPVLQTMYGTAEGIAVDGVIQIDPQGLAALIEGTGPVEVPELGTVDAENLVPLVLSEAYARYPGIERRSDVLRDVAEAVFTKLVTGSYPSLRPLGAALAHAVEGRHVMVHSAPSSALAPRLADFGADGTLPDLDGPDAVHLTVQNVSANKLDYFVDTTLELTGDRRPGRLGKVQATITVHNGAEPGVTTPSYVYGPFNDDQVAGLYRGVVSLYLPAGSQLRSSSGDPPRDPPISVSEGGRPVVGYTVDLPAGATSRVVLELDLPPRPPDDYELLLVPSPRVRPTIVRTDLDLGGSRLVEELTMDRTWRLHGSRAPEAVSGGLQEEASSALGAYGMLRTSWWHARTPFRTRRDET